MEGTVAPISPCTPRKSNCPLCRKVLSENSVIQHLKRMHQQTKKEISSLVQKNSCPYCQKRFLPFYLQEHIARRHKSEDYKEDLSLKRLKVSEEALTINQHLTRIETNALKKTKSPGKPLTCRCGTTFEKQIYLSVHEGLYNSKIGKKWIGSQPDDTCFREFRRCMWKEHANLV
jgi:hypothetical protein